MFVSNVYFGIQEWKDNDPRIHKKANCKYRYNGTVLDVLYKLIKDDYLTIK